MKYIYMNHRIREKKPSGPVIVYQHEPVRGPAVTQESNTFALYHRGERIGSVIFHPNGLSVCETHDVTAWVEFHDGIEVLALPEPGVASAKKPNSKVRA